MVARAFTIDDAAATRALTCVLVGIHVLLEQLVSTRVEILPFLEAAPLGLVSLQLSMSLRASLARVRGSDRGLAAACRRGEG